MFSLVNKVLLSPLPFQEADRLVMLRETDLPNNIPDGSVSGPNYLDWRERSHSFAATTTAQFGRKFNLAGRGEPLALQGALVTPSFFEVFLAPMRLGRTFRADDAEAGPERVVILSHGVWQRHFGGDTNIVGQILNLNDQPSVVVGVMPHTLGFIEEMIELYAPLPNSQLKANRGSHYLQAFGRLKPGVSAAQATADLRTIAAAIGAQEPGQKTRSARVDSLHGRLVEAVRRAFLVLYSAVVLVLFIACTNVANLLLARSEARSKEMAIRAAMGASRWRVIRQLLAESVLLALGGAVLGLLLAQAGIDLLRTFAPRLDGLSVPFFAEIGVDGKVLVFTIAVAVLTGVLFGLVPAWHAAKGNLAETLKESTRSSSGTARRHRVLNAFVVSQMALTAVLLVAAGLLVRNLGRLARVNPGFDPERLLTLETELPRFRYTNETRRLQFYEEALDQMRALPGVQSAAVINLLPLGNNDNSWMFGIEGAEPLPQGKIRLAEYRVISPGYFETLRIPLRKGRFFGRSDDGRGLRVAIVNEALVRQYFANQNPLGRRIHFGGDTNALEIVGVVGDVRHFGLNHETPATIYQPFTQSCGNQMSFAVRTRGEPLTLAKAVQDQIWRVNPDLPVAKLRPMEAMVRESVSVQRFSAWLLMGFAVVGLLLAALGIYGVLAYVVGQRTNEIGVRLALGASVGAILRLVLGQGMKLALIGLGIGAAAALAVTRLMQGLLYEMSASDPLTFGLVLFVLAVVALLACYLPARRASKVDPMIALRSE